MGTPLDDVFHLSFINSLLYITLHPYIDSLYFHFIKSEYSKTTVIHLLNYKSKIIHEFTCFNNLSNEFVNEFVILCYENWHWLSIDKYKQKLKIPTSKLFTQISIRKILILHSYT